jgi:Uma2 family endonuclease
MPADTIVTFHGVSWEEYEELLAQVGEARGLRLSFDEGTLEVMTLSTEHENYAEFIKRLVDRVSMRLRLNIRFFGSATIRKQKRRKGKEPDACFYVQNAAAIGNKLQLDFATDPPPDIAVEVDIHHDSLNKFPIYAALGVPEIWRFDGYALTIYHLQENDYLPQDNSLALPILSSQALTNFLTCLSKDGEFQTLLAFDDWLQKQTSDR